VHCALCTVHTALRSAGTEPGRHGVRGRLEVDAFPGIIFFPLTPAASAIRQKFTGYARLRPSISLHSPSRAWSKASRIRNRTLVLSKLSFINMDSILFFFSHLSSLIVFVTLLVRLENSYIWPQPNASN
jgi:hypothetical protein